MLPPHPIGGLSAWTNPAPKLTCNDLVRPRLDFDVREALSQDAARLETLSWELPGLYVDASKQRWDGEVVDALLQLADEAGVSQAIADQFGGAAHQPHRGACRDAHGPSRTGRGRLRRGWAGGHARRP